MQGRSQMKNRTRNAIKWSYEGQGLSGRRGRVA